MLLEQRTCERPQSGAFVLHTAMDSFFVMPPSLLRLIVIIIGCTLSNMIGIYAVGMTVNERTMVKSYINKIKEKF